MEIDPWLARATARRPEAVALETPEERLTYRELLMAATRGAARLVGRGAAPGDRVAITLPAGRAFVVAFHACLLLRTPAMPVDPRLGERERKDLLRGAEFLVNTPLADGRRRAVQRRRAARGRGRADRPHLGHHPRAARRRAHVRQHRRPHPRRRRRARQRPRRALAVPDAALARRRADDPGALRRRREHGRARAVRRRAHRPHAAARATSRSPRWCRPCSPASSTPAAAPARGCAGSCSAAARARPRCCAAPPTRASRSPRPTG